MVVRKAVRRGVPKGALPDFTPVPRKSPRHDGWTAERQKAFIEALADTGCVAIAARMVNMSQPSVYQLRRQPGAESFRAAMDAAQTLGLQPVRDEAFDRAMNGQLVPVFVAGKLMGFRRKKNDRLLMFILRNYGFGPGGTRTTVNYVSSRASAGAATEKSSPAFAGEGDRVERGGGALAAAEASTTTVRTVMSGNNGLGQIAADESAANVLNAFEGVDLDAEAQAEIYRTLEACAERRRALEADPQNDPERYFIGERETTGYLGELESGVEGDWVEYRPEGEHRWEGLGEGGQAAEIDCVLAGMAERREQEKRLPPPEPDRSSSPEPPISSPRVPRRAYKKRTPKPPFTPPTACPGPRSGEARKAQAVAEVEAERRELAAAEAERRKARARRDQRPG